MRAVTWQGTHKVSVEEVPDPTIREPTDAIIRVTSTAICGSDLHLYDPLSPFMTAGDVLGHEPMGIVEEVGSQVHDIRVGDRVVIPFNISCGHCWMCTRGLYSQCETTQVTDHGTGAALLGYSSMYGAVPGGQAEYLRVPQAQFGPVKVPEGQPDEKFLYLSDVIPTAWQGVRYADTPLDGTLAVFGLGPIGQLAVRIAKHLGIAQVIGVDAVPERLALAAKYGAHTLDFSAIEDIPGAIAELTDGRGADAALDAVGMEAHGGPVNVAAKIATTTVGLLPKKLAQGMIQKAGVDRTTALVDAIMSVRRGGTVSISGVYGGAADPLPMMALFDKQVQVRMGQANVKRWVPDILPLLTIDEDPLGVLDLKTHTVGLDEAPGMYATFRDKEDGCIKVVIKP